MAEVDRQFAATDNRLREARREGYVARSAELSAAVSVSLAIALIVVGGAAGWRLIVALFESTLSTPIDVAAAGDAGGAAIFGSLVAAGETLAWLVLPIFGAAVVGAAAALIPSGWVWGWHCRPMASRLSPASNIATLFSLRSGATLLTQIVRLALIAAAAGAYGWLNRDALLAIAQSPPASFAAASAKWLLPMVAIACAAWVAIAIVDIFVQRRLFARDWRMSAAEVRSEQRDAQADPAMRQRQRQSAAWQMQDFDALVPRAAVVLTSSARENESPDADAWLTAAALVYDRAKMKAPLVVACGRGAQAARMLKIARSAGVPVAEHPQAANALANQFPARRAVPESLYNEVARAIALAMASRKVETAVIGEGN